ncbi:MAG: hypothetical protein QM817_24165 [Archangium sp.]
MIRVTCVVLALLTASCKCLGPPEGHTIYGSDLLSKDGKTYLTVAKSGVSAGCVLVLDGKNWSSLDAKTPVAPGPHTVGCRDGESMELEVVRGREYVVDYWGP